MNSIITAVITAFIVSALTVIVYRVELRYDCRYFEQFRINNVVYDCLKQEVDDG